MKPARRKTAGELSLKAANEPGRHDPLEIAQAMSEDIVKQLYICAESHDKIFDEEEYCLGLIVAYDPLIKHLRRHKYFAYPFLPMPRPQQVIFLYNKSTQKIRRLWSLPDAKVMATISEQSYVDNRWQKTKAWVDAFYKGLELDDRSYFHNFIRKESGITLPSEYEFLNTHREELIKAGAQDVETPPPEPFDFTKISIKQVINTQEVLA